jgi:hypothetical protein
MIRFFVMVMLASACCAETLITRRAAVQIDASGNTIPPNSIATPQQIGALASTADEAYIASTGMAARASACADRVRTFSTNYIVTSTVYVQSIGGVPYDPGNQTIRIQSFTASESTIRIVGTVAQLPLVPPALDWRVAINAGSWSNVTASVSQIAVPQGVTNAAAAYEFQLARPASSSSFFRIVDNSSGASGSGLWWVVFGGISVDGHRGLTGAVTNSVGAVTNVCRFVGGILVDPEPLGGF